MPTYSYRCTECGTAFDIKQAFTDETLTECPTCGGVLRKVFSPVGVTFNGSGFYRTDSRSGGAKGDGGSSGSSESGSSTSGGSGSTSGSDSKPSAPTTSAPATSTPASKPSSGSSSSGSSSGSSSAA